MRALEMMRQEPVQKLLPEYLRFYMHWAGTDYSADLAALDLKNHPCIAANSPANLGHALSRLPLASGDIPSARLFVLT